MASVWFLALGFFFERFLMCFLMYFWMVFFHVFDGFWCVFLVGCPF